MSWLGDHPYILIPLGLLLAYLVMRGGFAVVRMIASAPSDVELAETEDVEAYDVGYRCRVCATEIRLTKMAKGDDGEDFAPPRHCREDMALIAEAGS